MTVWTINQLVHPSIVPLCFLAPSSDALELAVRLMGVALIHFSDHGLAISIATEFVAQGLPQAVKDIQGIKQVTDHLANAQQKAIMKVQKMKDAFILLAKKQQLSRTAIDRSMKLIPQAVAASIYLLLHGRNHPLFNTLYYGSFLDSIGTLGKNFKLLDKENCRTTRSLSRLPLQLITGVGFTVLESFMETQNLRTLGCLAAIVITTPMLGDHVIDSDFYQERVITAIKQTLIPKYKAITAANHYLRAISLLSKVLPPARYAIKVAQGVGAFVVVTQVARKSLKIANSPLGLKIRQASSKTINVYWKVYSAAVIEAYIGPEIATAIVSISNKPADTLAVVAQLTGLATAFTMQSSAYGMVTSEIINETFRQPGVKKGVQTMAIVVKTMAVHSFQKLNEALESPNQIFNYWKLLLPFGQRRENFRD